MICLRQSTFLPPLKHIGFKHSPLAFAAMATSAGNVASDANKSKVKTGILMLNMGGPSSLEHVEPFLTRLFTDTDIMQMPFQSSIGPWIARRRSPKVAAKYAEIGGKSPILDWTRKQGEKLIHLLNTKRPESAPHAFYVGFRYAEPLLDEALDQMSKDGVEHAVAFSQYPHYSCTTTGSSFNQLARTITQSTSDSHLRKIKWTLIDRWPLNEGLIESISDAIQAKMNELPANSSKTIILFSAHSLPLSAVNRGDTYPAEVGSTVIAVMEKLKNKYPYRLVWQSKVGPAAWLEPKTDDAIREYAKKGIKNFLLVPIAFVNEHIETLHEMDIEFAVDLKKELDIDNILRVPTPNDNDKFINGIYQLVDDHLTSGPAASQQMTIRCPKCVNPACADMRKWIDSLL